jgi:hypothetical protein
MNARLLALLGLVAVLVQVSFADVYMHNPRGSNNRLNENGVNRANANRLMDTQNNDKGGYCWGPPLHYYVGSHLMIEWTNQHACSNPKVICNLVLQYMCGPEVRDGTVTTTIPDDAATYNQKVDPSPLEGQVGPQYKYGMHESYQYYQDCKARERNRGLFTADQNLNNRRSARHTRQDNNGNRHGFECPEERDYYPYWHPTPWKDIAVLVWDTATCPYFQAESQNVKAKNRCSDARFNTQATCTAAGATWEKLKGWGIDAPDCVQAPWSRDNHLGNTLNGYASSYNWTIPNDVNDKCVLRLRYNITTGDYPAWPPEGDFVNATFNGETLSPVKQDEIVPYYNRLYEMALNTDQYGRTFQDRSHTFAIRERPSWVPDSARIWNLNVRGKRGNIVQVYPAVEYDFVPNRLHTRVGDYVHFQWTGCDTNPANNDGEGTRQTDRSNIVQIRDQSVNYPDPRPQNPMFDSAEWMDRMAFVNQSNCLTLEQLREKNGNNDNAIEQDVQNCMKLNAGPPYFDGNVHRMNKTGVFHYMGSRNNNFSNRSQKAVLFVDDLLPTWSIAVITVASSVFVAGAAVGGVILYAASHPTSAVAGVVGSVSAAV